MKPMLRYSEELLDNLDWGIKSVLNTPPLDFFDSEEVFVDGLEAMEIFELEELLDLFKQKGWNDETIIVYQVLKAKKNGCNLHR